ncbi:MAG: class I SAM-dependent methyltransferase [Actinomycetota bacterium]
MADRPFDAKQYWEQRLGSHEGLVGVGNLSLGPAYVPWLYRVRRRVFKRIVRSSGIDVDGARVLDVGSGTGFYVDLWRSAGAGTVVATDLTEVAVDRLRARGIRAEEVDIGADGQIFDPGSFDVVSAFDVLFHVVDDDRYEQALRNVRRLLRPGGWFVFTDLPVASGSTRRAAHQVRRAESDVLQALERNGLRLETRMPSFVLMEAPAAARRAIWPGVWKALVLAPSRLPVVGPLLGPVLYPVELVLTRVIRRGASIQAFVCMREPD